MYTVVVQMDNLAPGAEVELDGLGIFKNGEPEALDNDIATHFKNARGVTPLQAFKNTYGVSIVAGAEDSEAVTALVEPEVVETKVEEKPAPAKRAPRKAVAK